jgi:hypothetical protein
MTEIDIHAAFAILRETMPNLPQPLIDGMAAEERNPFRVLIATILSLRTKDTLTAVVAPRLFAEADTPESMLELGEPRIAELIYPVGFYNTKAHSIVEICRRLIEQYSSRKPHAHNRVCPARHLRRYPCPPDQQYLGLCQDKNARRHGARATSKAPGRVLDPDQRTARHPRAADLPPDIATL